MNLIIGKNVLIVVQGISKAEEIFAVRGVSLVFFV
jgi:hypothetical protein